jgi:putative ABC transport system substrate-binding protein
MIGDPVGSGLAASLARPGGNITGLSGAVGPELAGKQLELLNAMVPQVSRIAILRNPDNPFHPALLREAGIVARALMLQLQVRAARRPDDLDKAFAAMIRERPIRAGSADAQATSAGAFQCHPASDGGMDSAPTA